MINQKNKVMKIAHISALISKIVLIAFDSLFFICFGVILMLLASSSGSSIVYFL
jgi:hypothetical protein